MSSDTHDTLTALLAVAMSANSGVMVRVQSLVMLAERNEAQDEQTCSSALRKAVQLVSQHSDGPDEALGEAIWSAGRLAEQAGMPTLAREAYELACAGLLTTNAGLGGCWIDIADLLQTEESFVDALGAYRTAVELLDDTRTLAGAVSAQTGIGECSLPLGDHASALGAFHRALALLADTWAVPSNSTRDFAHTCWRVGRLGEKLGESAMARAAYERAAELTSDAGDRGTVEHDIGDTYAAEGEHALALAHYREAIPLLADALPRDRLMNLVAVATSCAEAEDEAESGRATLAELIGLLQDTARESAASPDDLVEVARAAGRAGELLESFELARQAFRVSLAAADDAVERARSLRDLGDTWLANGDRDEAIAAYRQSLSSLAPVDVAARVGTHLSIAHWHHLAGDHEAAKTALRDALATLMSRRPTDSQRLDWSQLAYEVAVRAESYEAYALARRALEVEIGFLDDEIDAGRSWHAIARTWSSEGDSERAVDSYRVADRMLSAAPPAERAANLVHMAWIQTGEDATASVRRAIQLLAGDGVSAPTGVEIPEIASSAGRLAEERDQPELAREAYAIAERLLADRGALGICNMDIGDTWVAEQAYDRAVERYLSAIDLLPTDSAVLTSARINVVGCYVSLENDVLARRALADAASSLRHAASAANLSDADLAELGYGLGQLAQHLDRGDIARDAYGVAVERADDHNRRGVCLTEIGDTWMGEGELGKALDSYMAGALALATSAVLANRVGNLVQLARCNMRLGDAQAVEGALTRALDAFDALRSDDDAAETVTDLMQELAGLATAVGRADLAGQALTRAAGPCP